MSSSSGPSCMGVSLEVFAICAVIAWECAGIVYLTYDVDVCGPRSLLWDFALTWIFTVPFVILCYFIDYCVFRDTGNKIRFFAFRNNWYPIILAIVTLGLFVFGEIILYESYTGSDVAYTCQALKNTGLWTWSLLTFWTHIALVGLILLLVLFAPSFIFFENWALVSWYADKKRKQRGEFIGHQSAAEGERSPFVSRTV